MTRSHRKPSALSDPYCNTGDRLNRLELLVDGIDPHRCGELAITVRGQRVILEGPDGARFDGSLGDLCDLLKYAAEYQRADAVRVEADAELMAVREVRAEFEQRLANFNWYFGLSAPASRSTSNVVRLSLVRPTEPT